MKTYMYKAFKEEELLYVGITNNLPRRFHQHEKFSAWYKEFNYVEINWFPTRRDAAVHEKIMIIAFEPRYNLVHNKFGSLFKQLTGTYESKQSRFPPDA